jgi:type VI secretion system protein ImpE
VPILTMNATELYRAGRLEEAVAALVESVRRDPTDSRGRTFLFELLCFAGDLDRAEKHLNVLAGGGREAEMGALLYRAALHAERSRRAVFSSDGMPPSTAQPRPVTGTLNGSPFTSFEDGDPRLGARLEIFAAGQYTWLPLEHVASVQLQAPKRLRDLLWAPALVQTGPGFQGMELGEVMIPVLTPEAHTHADPAVRLGRVTEWLELPDGREAPVGQKLFSVDGSLVPLLEVRELVISGAAGA